MFNSLVSLGKLITTADNAESGGDCQYSMDQRRMAIALQGGLTRKMNADKDFRVEKEERQGQKVALGRRGLPCALFEF
jgi:hypothetical protein